MLTHSAVLIPPQSRKAEAFREFLVHAGGIEPPTP